MAHYIKRSYDEAIYALKDRFLEIYDENEKIQKEIIFYLFNSNAKVMKMFHELENDALHKLFDEILYETNLEEDKPFCNMEKLILNYVQK